jgi:hypothetical protein
LLFRLFAFRKEECVLHAESIFPYQFCLLSWWQGQYCLFSLSLDFLSNALTCLSDIWLLIPKRQLINRNENGFISFILNMTRTINHLTFWHCQNTLSIYTMPMIMTRHIFLSFRKKICIQIADWKNTINL